MIEQLGKDRFDRGDVHVKIQMFLLDIQDEGMFRFEKAQRAVALIALRDKIFAARIPVCVRAEDRNLRADVMRRMRPALAQNVRRHRGGRRLAVHAGDDDSAFACHDRGQRFRAADERLSSSAPAREDRIVVLDRRRKNHQLSIVRIARAVWEAGGLITYFTAGEPEARAWPCERESAAPQAAAKIHTDFEKHFIRAEVTSVDELVAAGSMDALRAAGKLRVEGRDYRVQDGDVVFFRVGR